MKAPGGREWAIVEIWPPPHIDRVLIFKGRPIRTLAPRLAKRSREANVGVKTTGYRHPFHYSAVKKCTVEKSSAHQFALWMHKWRFAALNFSHDQFIKLSK